MKRTLTLIISITVIILVILLSKFYEYNDIKNELKAFNSKYEKYLDKEIHGTDIATLINQAFNDNEENTYIQDSTDQINIDVKINDLEEDQIYKMDTLYNGGMAEFVRYYGSIAFKCTKIEYNSKQRVKYLLLEQMD